MQRIFGKRELSHNKFYRFYRKQREERKRRIVVFKLEFISIPDHPKSCRDPLKQAFSLHSNEQTKRAK